MRANDSGASLSDRASGSVSRFVVSTTVGGAAGGPSSKCQQVRREEASCRRCVPFIQFTVTLSMASAL